MELKDLSGIPIILVLTGLFFALGIIILASFQTETYQTGIVVSNEAFIVPRVNQSVTLANTDITSFTSVTNGTVTLPAANYSVVLATGVLTIPYQNNASALCGNGTTCYANYVYTETETDASVSVTNTITALGEIPNNWLVLFMVVIAASILVGILMSNLGGVGRRD